MLIPVYCKNTIYYQGKEWFTKYKKYYIKKEHFDSGFNIFVFHNTESDSGLWVNTSDNSFYDSFSTNQMYLRKEKLKKVLCSE